MNIILNGEQADAPENELISGLLNRLGLDGPVAVQINEEIIHHEKLGQVTLKAGDRVELLRMMGGG